MNEKKQIRIEKVFRDGSEAVARVSYEGDTADLRFGYVVEGGCVHCFITDQADEALRRLLPGRPRKRHRRRAGEDLVQPPGGGDRGGCLQR